MIQARQASSKSLTTPAYTRWQLMGECQRDTGTCKIAKKLLFCVQWHSESVNKQFNLNRLLFYLIIFSPRKITIKIPFRRNKLSSTTSEPECNFNLCPLSLSIQLTELFAASINGLHVCDHIHSYDNFELWSCRSCQFCVFFLSLFWIAWHRQRVISCHTYYILTFNTVCYRRIN